jgi:hypothetical protein
VPDGDGHALGVEVEVEAAGGVGGGTNAARGVVEDGQGGVIVAEARVVLPGDVGGGTVGEVGEGVVFAAEAPEDGTGAAVDVGEAVGVARGDEEVALGVFVDAVDVEEVPWVIGRLAVAFEPAVNVGEVDVLGRPPLEEELPRLDVDFLERPVPDPAVLGAAGGAQVRGPDLVDAEDGRLVARDVKLMEVRGEAVRAADRVGLLVGGVQLRVV